MKTSFDTWLSAMAEGGKGGSALGPTDIPQFVRGLAWTMPVALPGNWSGSTIGATISSGPDAGTALATAAVSAGSYDPDTQYTTWTLSLPGNTAFPADADGNGVECWPILITFTPAGGSTMPLLGGAFTVVGKV